MFELLTNKLFLTGLTLILTLILSAWMVRRYKLTRYQVFIFVLLVLFWSAINLIRAYRKAYAGGTAEAGGLGMDAILAANVAAAYGLISIFVRLPFFALSDYFKSRKFFIGLALVFVFISSIWVVFDPSYMSLLTSSLALGLGASLLSLFNVLFSETFEEHQALMSVSILSVAPLLAEFLMSPIQYMATLTKPNNYPALWAISAGLALVAFVFLLFVKDNKGDTRNFTVAKFKFALSDRRFLILSLMGVLVSFVRFASSGSNIVAFAKTDLIAMHPLLVAYIDMVYAGAQLIGGVLVGLYLKKKIGVRNTMILGLSLSVLFSVFASFVTDSWTLFWLSGLNGFGYGLTYNVLLGLAMQPFAKEMREITMGIYQTFFAVGIYYGDKIYALIIKFLPVGLSDGALYQAVFKFLSILGVTMILCIYLVFSRQNKAYLES